MVVHSDKAAREQQAVPLQKRPGGSILLISSISEADVGEYTCEAQNGVRDDEGVVIVATSVVSVIVQGNVSHSFPSVSSGHLLTKHVLIFSTPLVFVSKKVYSFAYFKVGSVRRESFFFFFFFKRACELDSLPPQNIPVFVCPFALIWLNIIQAKFPRDSLASGLPCGAHPHARRARLSPIHSSS